MRTIVMGLIGLSACGDVESNAKPDARPDTPAPDTMPDAAQPPRCNPSSAFGVPQAVAELNTTPSSEDSPFLTSDELTIYFSSTRSGGIGNWDIYIATRTSRDVAFGTPQLVPAINTAQMERRPVVTGDGLYLYSDTFVNDYDISISQRTSTSSNFASLARLPILNLGTNDGDPYVLADHSAMYFSTDATGSGDIYRAARSGATFATPEVVTGVNLGAGDLEASPVLTPDELTMYFQSSRTGSIGGSYDVWMTTRTAITTPFTDPVNVTVLNTANIDVPHWVSTDGCVLYFTRDVDSTNATDYDIFRAVRGN